MDQFPGTGLITTHSLNSIVTDSAPGMACYVHGQPRPERPGGRLPRPHDQRVLLPARRVPRRVPPPRCAERPSGIVSTADLEDATPAANAVHTGNRSAGQGIVDQYLDERSRTGSRVLLGGGRRWFLPQGETSARAAARATTTDRFPADLQAGWGVARRSRRREPRPHLRLRRRRLHLRRLRQRLGRAVGGGPLRRSCSASSPTAT